MTRQSLMLREAAQAPAVAARQIAANRDRVAEAAARLRALDAPFAATLARGSSDQAALFAKMLFETHAAMPTLSHFPSIGAIYDATSPKFAGVPMFAISQSGRSPDLIAAAKAAQAKGASVFALVNDEASPLAELADIVLPLHAGAETSVAATKSFIATLVALAQLTAEWADDDALRAAVIALPETLAAAAALDWTPAMVPLAGAESLLVIGRGLTLPIAGEAALKFKETAGLHAEAFSGAEVAHGPMTLVERNDPVFVFGASDATRASVIERIEAFAARGATVIAAGDADAIATARVKLPVVAGAHPVAGAIAMIQSFYGLANALSFARGRDPDRPPFLKKVTQTL